MLFFLFLEFQVKKQKQEKNSPEQWKTKSKLFLENRHLVFRHSSVCLRSKSNSLNPNLSMNSPKHLWINIRRENKIINNTLLGYNYRILLTSNISIKISIKFQQRYFLSSCRKPLQRMGAAQNDCKEKRRAESLKVAKITCRKKKSTLSIQILKNNNNNNSTGQS